MRDLRNVIASAVLLGSAATMPLAAASVQPPGLRLQPLTREDREGASTVGIGCYWSLPRERATRLAATDDRAAIKIEGRVNRLRPARNAKDLFPFTYDAWIGSGDALRLTLVKVGAGRRRGTVFVYATVLTITAAGRTWATKGTMQCGD